MACENPPVKKELYSILVDTTDEHLSTTNAAELLSVMNLKNEMKSVHLRYSEITDVDFNKVKELSFAAATTGLLGNEVKAKRKRIQFEKGVGQLLAPKDSILEAQYSSIFDPIIRELQFLSKQTSYTKKKLIVYSNLMENSQWVSFYTSKEYYLLMYRQKTTKFPTTDLELQIVYIPHNQKDNMNFKALQKLYLEVFDQIGIPVSFTANVYQAHSKL